MEQSRFFIWVSRINSILFLLLLTLAIGFVLYGMSESSNWRQRNAVKVVNEKSHDEKNDNLQLSDITKVCGQDVQYVRLTAASDSKGFSSSGYIGMTRNIVFFVGDEMQSHWLFETDKYVITKIDPLKKEADDCKDKETVSIYYQVVKNDTNKNGELDDNDEITIALTSPDGSNYVEIDSGLSAVIDHSINSEATELTVLAQKGSALIMKKFSLASHQKISEKEISRIGKMK